MINKIATGLAGPQSEDGTPTPQAPQPVYQYTMRLNPQTNRYEYVPVDPQTGQVVTEDQFDAERSTRYSTRRMLDEIYNQETKTCPEGYQYDPDTDTCKKVVADETLPDTTNTVSRPVSDGGDGDGDGGPTTTESSRPTTNPYGVEGTYGYIPRGMQVVGGLLGGPLAAGAIALNNAQAIAKAQEVAGIPVQSGLGGIVDRALTDPYDSLGVTDINGNTYSINFGGGLTDEGRTGLTPFEAAKRRKDIAAWEAREDKPSAFTTPESQTAAEIAQQNEISYQEAAGLAMPTYTPSGGGGGQPPVSSPSATPPSTAGVMEALQKQQSGSSSSGSDSDGYKDNGIDRDWNESGPTIADTKAWLSGETNAGGQARDRSGSNDSSGSDSNKGGGCFITTAVTKAMGLADDDNNYILNAFRKFRDDYMGGKQGEASEYYTLAPKIIEAIGEDTQAYVEIWDTHLRKAFDHLTEGDLDSTYNTYKNMVKELESKYL